MDSTYADKLKDWIELDNQALQLKTSMTELNEKKKGLEEDILQYVEQNNLENITVCLTEGKLKFPKVSVKQSLSMKYLKAAFTKYNEGNTVNGQIDVDDLCKFLMENLETTSKVSIKRSAR